MLFYTYHPLSKKMIQRSQTPRKRGTESFGSLSAADFRLKDSRVAADGRVSAVGSDSAFLFLERLQRRFLVEAENAMYSGPVILELIGLIYDAAGAGDATRWPAFLSEEA